MNFGAAAVSLHGKHGMGADGDEAFFRSFTDHAESVV